MSEVLQLWLEYLPQMLEGLLVSLQVTGASLAVGFPIGLLMALTVQSRSRAVRWTTLALVEIGRGAPVLVILQFAYFGLPSAGLNLSSFVASVASLAWTTAAYSSEMMRAGLQAVPRGQLEAAEAVGFSRLDELRFVIVPQALLIAAPALLGFAILMLQASSLCFAIALPELLATAYMIGTDNFRYLDILIFAGVLYAAVCIPATIAVSLLEKRLGRFSA